MPATAGGALTLTEQVPRARRRVSVVLLLVVALVTAGALFAARTAFTHLGAATCRASAMNTTVTFSPEQMDNAATISAIALHRGLPARAATIALATAIQESKLQNIDYGDRDSIGLFQQRPSQGWGTVEQIMRPEYAANKFYDELVKIDGYADMEITNVAQAVQRSAAPLAYADHETEGRVLASALTGFAPGDFGCRMDRPTAAADVSSLQRQLQDQFGVAGTRSGKTLRVTMTSSQLAWAVGSWSVAKAQTLHLKGVTVGTRTWTPSTASNAWAWTAAGTGSAPNGNTVVIFL